MESRALDRVTAFTDAAVAIAVTLLVLPLVDVAHQTSDAAVATLLRDHRDDLLAFGLSFFVVMAFWRGHRRLLEPVVRLDETMLSLNVFWLLGIVFLPVPTAVLSLEGDDERTAAMLYLANLLFVALMSLGLAAWIRLHPALLGAADPATTHQSLYPGIAVCGSIAAVTMLALPLGADALPLLAALPIGQAGWRWIEHRRTLSAKPPPAHRRRP
jgi:uncharacterized membrane protein